MQSSATTALYFKLGICICKARAQVLIKPLVTSMIPPDAHQERKAKDGGGWWVKGYYQVLVENGMGSRNSAIHMGVGQAKRM